MFKEFQKRKTTNLRAILDVVSLLEAQVAQVR